MSGLKTELAEEHWKWLEPVLFESYRVGILMSPSGDMELNEDIIKEGFSFLVPLLKRLYIDAFLHGAKHEKEAKT